MQRAQLERPGTSQAERMVPDSEQITRIDLASKAMIERLKVYQDETFDDRSTSNLFGIKHLDFFKANKPKGVVKRQTHLKSRYF